MIARDEVLEFLEYELEMLVKCYCCDRALDTNDLENCQIINAYNLVINNLNDKGE